MKTASLSLALSVALLAPVVAFECDDASQVPCQDGTLDNGENGDTGTGSFSPWSIRVCSGPRSDRNPARRAGFLLHRIVRGWAGGRQ